MDVLVVVTVIMTTGVVVLSGVIISYFFNAVRNTAFFQPQPHLKLGQKRGNEINNIELAVHACNLLAVGAPRMVVPVKRHSDIGFFTPKQA